MRPGLASWVEEQGGVQREGPRSWRRWLCLIGGRRSLGKCPRWPSWGWSPADALLRRRHRRHLTTVPVWAEDNGSSIRQPQSPPGRRQRTQSPQSERARRWALRPCPCSLCCQCLVPGPVCHCHMSPGQAVHRYWSNNSATRIFRSR